MLSNQAPIFAISRHRINRDGDGVVSLVAFYGCPLRCQYCFNQGTWEAPAVSRWWSPEQLYNEVQKDELYFLATNGGVTFGGGEPMLRAPFIRRFRELCGPLWKLRVETSLCCPVEAVAELASCVDEWIIDVKSMNPNTYEKYTGRLASRRNACLQYLADHHLQERCMIRLPNIPNHACDQQKDERILREVGFKRFEKFDYVIPK
jgi:pyruvate formate lyase activating enzyme